MMAPLLPDHEDRACEIAKQEVRNFVRLLADEFASTPARADGNVNARDLWATFNNALKRYDAGEGV